MTVYKNTFFCFIQLRKKIAEKSKDGTLQKHSSSSNGDSLGVTQRKRGRWDQTIDEQFVPASSSAPKKKAVEATPSSAPTPTWGEDVSRKKN